MAVGVSHAVRDDGEHRWFAEASALGDELLRLFHDEERGGFFQTGDDAEALVLRPKDLYDNAVPSGNSAAAEVLLRLALFTGEARYEQAGSRAATGPRRRWRRRRSGSAARCARSTSTLGPAREVAIVGDPATPRPARSSTRSLRSGGCPTSRWRGRTRGDEAAREAVPLLRDRTMVDGRPGRLRL